MYGKSNTNAPARTVLAANGRTLLGSFCFDVVELVDRDALLLQVVDALRAAGRFARGLHRRQQQRHQNADDGDHHQQLDQGEAAPRRRLQVYSS